jgi:hypothetical protein
MHGLNLPFGKMLFAMKQRSVLSPSLDELTHWGVVRDNDDGYAMVVSMKKRPDLADLRDF